MRPSPMKLVSICNSSETQTRVYSPPFLQVTSGCVAAGFVGSAPRGAAPRSAAQDASGGISERSQSEPAPVLRFVEQISMRQHSAVLFLNQWDDLLVVSGRTWKLAGASKYLRRELTGVA